MTEPKNHPRTAGIALLTILLLALNGCALAPLDEIAPPVATLGSAHDPTDRLKQGREIYVTDCASCHMPKMITNYPPAEWPEILADMTDRAQLTPSETAAVEAYVFAVLNTEAP